jgi:hypothetical protein
MRKTVDDLGEAYLDDQGKCTCFDGEAGCTPPTTLADAGG